MDHLLIVVEVGLTLLNTGEGGPTLLNTGEGGHTLLNTGEGGHTIIMTDTGHIPGPALHTAGLLSAYVTDHTLPMTLDMTQLMIATIEGTVTGQFPEVCHPSQGGQGGGATQEVPLLFEVSPPGQGRDQEGVIQEALEGVVVIPNLSILDQEAQVYGRVLDPFQGPILLDLPLLQVEQLVCPRLALIVVLLAWKHI